MEVYLDNAATTATFGSVRMIMSKVMEEDYGNPSSLHRKGFEAEEYLKEAKKILATTLKVDAKEIFFTSGGTESNNLALIGAAFANRRAGNHIITTKIEHPSVHNPLIYLEEQGFRISYIDVDENGFVREEQLQKEISEDTILVSIMHVNNEIGAVQDIEKLARVIKGKKPDVIFHVDAIQSYGKYHIYPKRFGIDLLSVSGHKIHGPKGIGLLYIRDKVKVRPIIFGGQQQKGIRSGTENVPGIAGLAEAAKVLYTNHEQKILQLYHLKEIFVKEVLKIEGVKVNGLCGIDVRMTAPHITSVSFQGIKSEVLLHALEDRGIYVSSGSACASNHPQLSGTLKAIGVDKGLLDSTLRISMSVQNSEEDIKQIIDALKELVSVLRKFSRH